MRIRFAIQTVVQALVRSGAFALGYAALGVAINAGAAFGGEPNPKFSRQLIFNMNNAVLSILLAAASGAYLVATAVTLFVAPRQLARKDIWVAFGAGLLVMLATNFIFLFHPDEIALVLIPVLGATAGVLCTRRPPS